MTDKEFWSLFARGLLMIVNAIIRKYDLNITPLKDKD